MSEKTNLSARAEGATALIQANILLTYIQGNV